MSTTNTTQTMPAGFTTRTVTDHVMGETDDYHQGPEQGGVSTSWHDDRGITVAVDGYDRDSNNGIDLTPADAARLRDDLTAVLARLN